MVIWNYDVPAAAKSVGWAVVVNNLEALRSRCSLLFALVAGRCVVLICIGDLVLLDSAYPAAALLAFSGALVRSVSTNLILYWTGLPMSGWGFEGWV